MKLAITPPVPNSQRECPICGNEKVRLMFSQEFAKIEGVSFLGGYDVVSCEQCGFVYASNIPSQEAFTTYYINANKYEHEIEQPDIITGRYEHIIQEIVRFYTKKTASIVDIGCARSEVLRTLRSMGFSNLTGVDPSVKNIEYLETKGIAGIHATIKNMNTSKQYEVVLFLAVLEHICDLHEALDNLYAVTASNGMAIVSVPDMSAPASGEFPFQEFSREHINYFTFVSLSNLMGRHGFQMMTLKKERGELIGFFKKELTETKPIQKDINGERNIQKYIDQSKKYEDAIYEDLLQYKDTPIIVWGLGTFTQRLLTKKILMNIVVLVDSNPQYADKKYNNISIIPPDGLKNYKEPIVLAVSIRYIEAIAHTIKNELKLDNEIITLHTLYEMVE